MTDQPNLEPAAAVEPGPADAPIPGFHVMLDGASLGVYPTAADAEAFANGHPRANGLTVEIVEVKA